MVSIQSKILMKRSIFLPAVILFTLLFAGCDENLVEMNTDPLRLSELPDEYLFTTAVRMTVGDGGYISAYNLRFGSQYAHILCYQFRIQGG